MKQGKTLVELAQEIERQASAKLDGIADTRSMKMTDTGQLTVNGFIEAPAVVRPHAHNQIGARLKIDAKYYDRCLSEAPALLATNVNHWFNAAAEKRLVRTMDGQVRAFLSNRYQRIDNNHVANTVLPMIEEVNKKIGGLRLASCEITESRLYIKVVFDSMAFEIPTRVGDVVACGLMFKNSETGMGALSVEQFMDRLRCTNGMIGTDVKRRFNHVGKARDTIEIEDDYTSDTTKRLEDITTLSKVRDVVNAALDEKKFQEFIAKLGVTTGNKIEGDVVQAVEVLGDSFDMLEGERKTVLRHLIEGGELTQFGLIQAVTRTATDLESYDRATRFEQFGGQMVNLSQRDWSAIATAA